MLGFLRRWLGVGRVACHYGVIVASFGWGRLIGVWIMLAAMIKGLCHFVAVALCHGEKFKPQCVLSSILQPADSV
jgi:hypothetical protein